VTCCYCPSPVHVVELVKYYFSVFAYLPTTKKLSLLMDDSARQHGGTTADDSDNGKMAHEPRGITFHGFFSSGDSSSDSNSSCQSHTPGGLQSMQSIRMPNMAFHSLLFGQSSDSGSELESNSSVDDDEDEFVCTIK